MVDIDFSVHEIKTVQVSIFLFNYFLESIFRYEDIIMSVVQFTQL